MYEINPSKSPTENLLLAINLANATSYRLKNFLIRELVDNSDGSTTVNVDILNNGSDSEDEYVSFTLTKFEIGNLFSEVVETKHNRIFSGKVLIDNTATIEKIKREMMRKYCFFYDENYYSLDYDGSNLTIECKSTNPIFKGRVVFVLEDTYTLVDETVDLYKVNGLSLELKALTVAVRDSNANLSAKGIVTHEASAKTASGAMLFRTEDGLALVEEPKNVRRLVGATNYHLGADKPTVANLGDIWIEKE